MLTAEQVSELLSYSSETGLFTWKVSGNNRIKVGGMAGCKNPKGYLCIKIYKRRYQAHRVAWLIVNGEWPADQIDHINGVRDDNRIENLRVVTRSENMKNQKTRSTNTSGVMGVCWDKRSGKWLASIWVNNSRLHIGYFHCLEIASKARKAAEIKYEFHPNHGRA